MKTNLAFCFIFWIAHPKNVLNGINISEFFANLYP